jgi:hypothetical protein
MKKQENSMSVTSPDTMMAASIQHLVMFAANHIERIEKWLALGAPRDGEVWRRWCDTEDRLGHACRVALILRATEVVVLCESIRLRGCTEALVRENPFKIAMAIRFYLHGGNDREDHETED